MNPNKADEISTNDTDKPDPERLSIEQVQQDLYLAKGEIKTAIRDIAINQNFTNDLLLKLRSDFRDIDERLHGMELRQQRENSST